MRNTYSVAALTAILSGGLCLAGDKWETKDPSAWSSQEIDKLTHDSPWAHTAKVALEPYRDSNGQNQGGGYPGGGGGYPGGGGGGRRGGIGLPGGIGIPFPGGGGGGYPGGGGGGRGGGRGGRDGGRGGQQSAQATVRWETALPLRQAYALQDPHGEAALSERPAADRQASAPGWKKADDGAPGGDKSKSASAPNSPSAAVPLSPNESPTEYVIAVTGLPLDSGRRRSQRQSGDRDSNSRADSNDSGDDNRHGRDADTIREELMERTTISRGANRALRPVSVEFDLPGRYGVIYFHFSREEAITLNDKEVTFQTQLGGNRLERKFELKPMVYKGKLEL